MDRELNGERRHDDALSVTYIIPWAVFHKGLKIESRRTPLIIRFTDTKTKLNILAKNLKSGTFVEIIQKGLTRVKCTTITENYISSHIFTNITDISTYEVSIPWFWISNNIIKPVIGR